MPQSPAVAWAHVRAPSDVDLAHLHARTARWLPDAARAVLGERNWNIAHHWTPEKVFWRDAAFDIDLLLRDHRPGRPLTLTTGDAQAVLHLHGHRPVALVDLADEWHEREVDWFLKSTDQDMLDLLAYEATGVSWRATALCRMNHGITRADIRAFVHTLGGHVFNTCYRAGLTRDELLAILAAGDVSAVGSWAAIETLAALNDPHARLLND